MIPLAAIGTGVSILGGVSGLLTGSRAERRAREAQERALMELSASYENESSSLLNSGRRGLFNLQGGLNDALESGGRSLGSALAGAGVYNSSATAGALANQAQANAATSGQYASDLSSVIARLRSQGQRDVAGYRMGFAANDMNRAREVQAGSAGGLMSMLGSLGQMSLDKTGTDNYNANKNGLAGNGMANSVLDMRGLRTDMPLAGGMQPTPRNFGSESSLPPLPYRPRPMNLSAPAHRTKRFS